MKKLLTLTLALAFLLAGCGAIAPVQPTVPPPSATPVVVVATVLVPVTVVQTQALPPTEVPTNTPVPPTQEPPTAAPANTSAPGGAATATATLPADAGGNLFTSLNRSGSFISLRCLPQSITFSVSTSNTYVVQVDFYYRLENLTTQPPTFTEWKNAGKMNSDKNGNYTLDFNVLQINPDLRAAARAWFDYQFVGLAKDSNAVGRSGKISQQILYSKDCP